MTCGIKKPNKFIRISIGILIIVGGLYFESHLWTVGLIPIVFAIIGICPLCYIFAKKHKNHTKT